MAGHLWVLNVQEKTKNNVTFLKKSRELVCRDSSVVITLDLLANLRASIWKPRTSVEVGSSSSSVYDPDIPYLKI